MAHVEQLEDLGVTEEGRLPALRRTRLLDSPPEAEFDRLTRLAARLLGAPVVLMVLVDEQREFLKSAVGLTGEWATRREAPLSRSLCRHVVSLDAPLIITDTRKDPSLHDTADLQSMGAYLGMPIHAPDGSPRPAIGVFCAIDDKPRHWTAQDEEVMRDLTAFLETEIASRWRLDEFRSLSDRFTHFMNASPVATFVFDIVERRTVFVSQGNAALFGSTPEEIKREGAEFLTKTLHIEDLDQLPDRLERLRHLADGETAESEYRIRHPDGSWHWFLSRHAVFSRDKSGTVRQIIGTSIDITDRKQAEEALRESEDRLELALSGAELGTWNWNVETDEVIYNPRWAEMLGYTLGEIEPNFSAWQRLVHPDDKSQVLSAIDAHVNGHTPHFSVEHRLRAADGSWKWILTSGKAFGHDPEGKPLRAAGIHLDITARKEAEAAVHAADRKLARILESMIEACSSVDADWRYTFVNPQWEAFFKLRKEEVIGRQMWDVSPEIYGTIIEELYRKAMATREPIRREILSPTIFRWLEIRIFPAADGSLSTFILDIHERKLAEEALREGAQRKDDFLAMLGHELRNPLAAIQHALDIGNLDEDYDTFRWVKGVVERQSIHLSRLVDDLLDVSRIARGKVELRKRRLDIATVLDQAVESTRPLIVQRRHELKVSYAHEVLWVDGDPSRLEQVIANLLNNAAKYTEPGGTIWLEAKRVNKEEDNRAEVVISVRDTGAGIAPEKIEHIFELFVQGERSLARMEGGLGLGLTIVKELTEMHGGYVMAESAGPDLGCTFTVHLPGEPAPAPAEPQKVASSPLVAATHRILVVDDHTDVAEGLARLLRRQGHTIEVAGDGFAACEKAHTFAPDIVLLDIGLPGLNGYEVVKRLRHNKRCADALIIALTGYGQEEDRRRALEAGFDEHLVKPIDFSQLKRLINEAPQQKLVPQPRRPARDSPTRKIS